MQAAPRAAAGGGEGRRRQAATHVSAVQIRLRQFTKHETRQRTGRERGRCTEREGGGVWESRGGEANKHFRKLHAFVKTKQCAKCLFVLVSAFQRKNDSAQKRQSSSSSRGNKEGRGGRELGNGVMREYTHESASLCLKMLQLLMGLLVVEIIVAASSGTTPCPPAYLPSPSPACRAAKREM